MSICIRDNDLVVLVVIVALDQCNLLGYTWSMIKSFVHKGLEQFFTSGSKSGIQAIHANRLQLLLAMLDQAHNVSDMDAPNLRLHQLKGEQKEYWSVTVQANWRMIFKFEAGDAYVVNYLDYH